MMVSGLMLLGFAIGRLSSMGLKLWWINALIGLLAVVLIMEGMIRETKAINNKFDSIFDDRGES